MYNIYNCCHACIASVGLKHYKRITIGAEDGFKKYNTHTNRAPHFDTYERKQYID